MAIPYYPDGNGSLWIKDDLAPFGTNVYYVQLVSGYAPDDKAIFDFMDNFNDDSIDSSKWFTDGTGTIEEINGTAHIVSAALNKYPRFVTKIPLKLKNYVVEYDVKITSAASEACRIGYTSYYTDGSELSNWFLYVTSDKYVHFWTRIDGDWQRRWSYNTALLLNTWYKIRLIDTDNGIKVRLLNFNSQLIDESDYYEYDYNAENSIYFGQRSTGDSGYFDNFTVRRYASIEPTSTVTAENSGYKVVVKNNIGQELHDYQISIPTTNIGTLTPSSSVYVMPVYKTPLKQPYYEFYSDCIMNIPHMNLDITNKHTMVFYNTIKNDDRFDISNSTEFSGINTRGYIATKSDLNLFNGNNFTLNMWLQQLDDYSTSWCALLSKAVNTTSTSNRWRLRINKNEVGFLIADSSSIVDFTGSANPIKINDQLWHMVTFVRNGSYLYTYKDGVYKQTLSLKGLSNFTNSDNVDIASAFTTINYSNYFNGRFGETTLYNTTYDTPSILNYYNLNKYKYINNIISGVQY